MCRSIKVLYNVEPAITDPEVRAAALQFVRKISGFTKPSQVNEEIFQQAVDEITAASCRLLQSLQTKAHPRSRDTQPVPSRG